MILTIIAGLEVSYQVKYSLDINLSGIRRGTNNMLTLRMTKLQLMRGMQDEKLFSPFLEMLRDSFVFS